jgi:hypothetical protein
LAGGGHDEIRRIVLPDPFFLSFRVDQDEPGVKLDGRIELA